MLERLLDSVILIDHFNGITPATRFLDTLNPDSTAISVITLAEILVGLDKEAAGKARLLLDQYRILSIDPPVAEKMPPFLGSFRVEASRCLSGRPGPATSYPFGHPEYQRF